jgi:hypothetical protein
MVGAAFLSASAPLFTAETDLQLRAAPPAPAPAPAPPVTAPPLIPPRSPFSSDATARLDSYFLRPTAGGGYVYEDERFTGRIAVDGTVAFTDHRVQAPALRAGLVDLFLDRRKPRRAPPPPQVMSPYRPDPKEMWQQRRSDHYNPLVREQPILLAGGGARFDITDEFIRMFTKDDPYRYEKAKFLTATFEMRIQLAVAARKRYLSEAVAELPSRLEAFWRDERMTSREKCRILALLFEELERKDNEVRQASDKAAEVLAKFIDKGSCNQGKEQ